jgi:hypothetical protein
MFSSTLGRFCLPGAWWETNGGISESEEPLLAGDRSEDSRERRAAVQFQLRLLLERVGLR